MMHRPIAIVNCRCHTAQGEIPSCVILVMNDLVTAVGPATTIPIPANAQLIDADQGEISDGEIDKNEKIIEAGRAANLVCRTRYGDVAWAMQRGIITFPTAAPPRPEPVTWESHRTRAIERVVTLLKKRPETRYIQRTTSIPGYQKRGVDILWRFEAKSSRVQTLSIRVVPTLDDKPFTLFILDGSSAQKLPTAGLSRTQAHWWFYHHELDDALYCAPIAALKRWMDAHAREFPPKRVLITGISQPLTGRAIPMKRLQNDIKRVRIIPLQSAF